MAASNASPARRTVKPNTGEPRLTPNKRVLLMILVVFLQMIYFPTSIRTSGGIEPKLPIDIFPVWPVWVLPYVLCYLLWPFSILWVIRKMDDRLFRSFILACFVTVGVSVSTFILFPTYVSTATLEGNDPFTSLLRLIHENLGRYDAFPSGHVYITTLLALFFSRWYPPHRFLWIAISIIVSLSTLFTGQHYVLDVLGGYLVAFAGYLFGLWWVRFLASRDRSGRT